MCPVFEPGTSRPRALACTFLATINIPLNVIKRRITLEWTWLSLWSGHLAHRPLSTSLAVITVTSTASWQAAYHCTDSQQTARSAPSLPGPGCREVLNQNAPTGKIASDTSTRRHERPILKRILKKYRVRVWTPLLWKEFSRRQKLRCLSLYMIRCVVW
jgi:hypothetical protein